MSPDLADVEVSFDQEQVLQDIEATFELPPETFEPVKQVAVDPTVHQMQLYGTTTEKIAALKSRCSELECDTKDGYAKTKDMIGLLRTTRTRIEKRRKDLNAEHHEAIRFVNGVAKQLTEFVENLEAPLKHKKLLVDEAKERAKREAEEAEQRALEAKLRAEREAEAAKLRAEAERLAKERAAFEAEQAKAAAARAIQEAEARAMQEQIAKDRREHEERRLAFEREEQARQARIQAQRDAEEAAVREAERQAELERRRAAAVPDVEKVRGFAGTLARVMNQVPACQSEEATKALATALLKMETIVVELMAFQV